MCPLRFGTCYQYFLGSTSGSLVNRAGCSLVWLSSVIFLYLVFLIFMSRLNTADPSPFLSASYS